MDAVGEGLAPPGDFGINDEVIFGGRVKTLPYKDKQLLIQETENLRTADRPEILLWR